MLPRAGRAALPPLLRALGAAPAAMSTGSFVVSQPLNYRGGARVQPADASGSETAFEPATGEGPGPGAGGPGGRAGGGPVTPRDRAPQFGVSARGWGAGPPGPGCTCPAPRRGPRGVSGRLVLVLWVFWGER